MAILMQISFKIPVFCSSLWVFNTGAKELTLNETLLFLCVL